MRRCVALALAVAVQAMLVELPALHAHLDDHVTDHHHARTIHAHFEQHHSPRPHDQPGFEADDHDSAVSFTATTALASKWFSAAVLTTAIADVSAAFRPKVMPSFEVTHGHDPPWIASLASRAPPACLF
jgi:hypothetical protein